MRFLLPAALLSAAAVLPVPTRAELTSEEREIARSYLEDFAQVLSDNYYPNAKADAVFRSRCKATAEHLAQAQSLNQAFGLIADTFASLDPRIEFHSPERKQRIDYSWKWQLIGNSAYVVQVDHHGDAVAQGLRLGDKVLTFEGMPLDRTTARSLGYAFSALAPVTSLHVQVQSPGGPVRDLRIAATLRTPPKLRSVFDGVSKHLEYTPTPRQWALQQEFERLKNHIRHLGPVMVWRADELARRISDVADGLAETRGAEALILDLRGQGAWRPETVMRLLDGIFADSFPVGVVKQARPDERLSVSGGSGAFLGALIVLVDSQTSGYAELLARVVQQRQRGVVFGDRTMGRVFREVHYVSGHGYEFNFTNASLTVPTGDVVLADGYPLDGRGVIPDYQLLPKPADLAGKRDVVMAKALSILKQPLSPEDAYKLFRTPLDDADESDED